MSASIRILIADDHMIVREGLRLIIESEAGMEVVGEAEDGARAVELAAEREPHVVLMDVRMPRLGGVEAVRRIRRDMTGVEIVILTMYDEDDVMMEALRAGARGYLLKDTDRETLLNTIRAAARGEALMGEEAFDKLVAAVADRPADRPVDRLDDAGQATRSTTERGGRPALTARELQVLEAVTRGQRTRQIAARLDIAERTVKAHLASIYGKLDVDSRAGAVAQAIRRGLVPDE